MNYVFLVLSWTKTFHLFSFQCCRNIKISEYTSEKLQYTSQTMSCSYITDHVVFVHHRPCRVRTSQTMPCSYITDHVVFVHHRPCRVRTSQTMSCSYITDHAVFVHHRPCRVRTSQTMSCSYITDHAVFVRLETHARVYPSRSIGIADADNTSFSSFTFKSVPHKGNIQLSCL